MTLTLADSIRCDPATTIQVRLLSGFEVRSPAGAIDVPHVGSRLVAYLALQQRPVSRPTVAGILWPETTQEKAQASLRSALWRVRRACDAIIECHHECLGLARSVEVDVDSLLAVCCSKPERNVTDLPTSDIPFSWFACELLPDWYDDWVVFERERFRLAILNSLDQLAADRRRKGDFRQAAEYALMAIRLEPLRESCQRELIEVHLAQGNLSEAVRQYRHYRQLLSIELGVEPTPLMTSLIEASGLDPRQL